MIWFDSEINHYVVNNSAVNLIYWDVEMEP